MRMFTLVSLVAVGLGLALVGREPAYAQTPTPTATPGATITPSPQQVAVFQGSAWVDARQSSDLIIAKIGDVVCAEPGRPGRGPGTGLIFFVSVVSEDVKPGCGREGATVTFFVGDQRASQTGIWHAGTTQNIVLTVPPPFARFTGAFSINQVLRDEIVLPYIGDRACGNYNSSWIGGGPGYVFEVAVYSSERQPGCGTEGAEVTFKLLDAAGNVIAVAQEKGIWHAWDGASAPQQLNLTMAPAGGPSIKIGNVGTGERHNEASSWQGLPLALAMIGLDGIAAGVALRRRAMGRPSA